MPKFYFSEWMKKWGFLLFFLSLLGISKEISALDNALLLQNSVPFHHTEGIAIPNSNLLTDGDLTAHDVYATTAKATKINIKVTGNDFIICDNYSIRIVMGSANGTAYMAYIHNVKAITITYAKDSEGCTWGNP